MAGLIKRSRIGVFGGTFDPPHIGHLILASEAAAQLSLERVLWILTQYPPHKQERIITPVEIRLKMLSAALEGEDRFEISRVEIDRPPPHYAVDTLKIIKQLHPEAGVVYLMGGDSLHDLPTWHNPSQFLMQCDLIGVLRRPGIVIDLADLEAFLPGIQEKIHWVEAPLIEISSSLVREKVRLGKSFQYYLLPNVARLVNQYRLYKDTDVSIR